MGYSSVYLDVIVETGFWRTQKIALIVKQSEKVTEGIARSIIRFLQRDFPELLLDEEG